MAEILSTALLLAQSAAKGFKERAQELILESQANIAHLEAQIEDLKHLRAREYSIIAALRLIIAPVRTLPSAVLGNIFIRALNAGNHRDGWTGSIRDVLVLTQAPAHIFREKGRGASVGSHENLFWNGPNLGSLMDALFGVPERWLSLTLSTKLLASLAQIPAGALTALETLDLRSTGGESGLHPNVNAFRLAPRLRRVTLWHVKNAETFMPWSQLTTIALAEESPRVCLDVIVRCSSLVSATLHMSGWPESVSFGETDTVTLEHLKSLEIHISNTSSEEHFTPFLQRLNLPSLTSLKMYGEYHSGVITWSQLAFTLFQIRSPLIQHLQIDHCALTSEDLQAVIHHVPNLSRLEVHNCSNCIDDAFLAALRYSPFDPAPFAPKLEVLWLSSLRCDFEETSLKDLVESRWWTEEELLAMSSPPAIARLKNVQYTSSRKFSRKFEKRIQVYRAEGLEFSTLVS
ncbi:hypothetical protein MVEN_01493100 [Mycena venus]|uniref:Uncharacterized protein n=1 Tax=Mycena venus TaxID=2733690 RepID=A0A8H6XSP8_9AGAR|nr:hypothetical protein MVEN_01493100 [Mycena venus]